MTEDFHQIKDSSGTLKISLVSTPSQQFLLMFLIYLQNIISMVFATYYSYVPENVYL